MVAVEKTLVKEQAAAIVLGIELRTLQDWRFNNVGPPYIKYSTGSRRGAVRYDMAELMRFVQERTVQPGTNA
jgi:hypothetical protein